MEICGLLLLALVIQALVDSNKPTPFTFHVMKFSFIRHATYTKWVGIKPCLTGKPHIFSFIFNIFFLYILGYIHLKDGFQKPKNVTVNYLKL